MQSLFTEKKRRKKGQGFTPKVNLQSLNPQSFTIKNTEAKEKNHETN
jgi:hypothetical protein|tara:strand:+ start:32 stop:172 length:141 start_codon:yes stop_codon:yes gene_type:complete